MKGSMRRRGERSWELKFDLGTDARGERQIAYRNFKGTRKEAEAKLTEYVGQLGRGAYVAPSKQTVTEFVAVRIETWSANGQIGATSAERYDQLLRSQIAPRIGHIALQNLNGIRLSEWHGELLTAGLAAQTVKSAHNLISKALNEAVRDGVVARGSRRSGGSSVEPQPGRWQIVAGGNPVAKRETRPRPCYLRRCFHRGNEWQID